MKEFLARAGEKLAQFFDRATLIRITTVVLLSIVSVMIFSRMQARSQKIERHMVRPQAFEVAACPSWVNGQIVDSVRQSVPSSFSIFKPDLLDFVRMSLLDSPWVEDITQGERVYPDQVQVGVKLRKPIALVRVDDRSNPRYYLVDRKGLRLPGYLTDPPESFPYPLPMIIGVRGDAPDLPAHDFADRAVAAGASLALDLYEWHNSSLFPRLHVLEIDVSNYDGRIDPSSSEVVLTTNVGVPVHWGRVNHSVHPHELDPVQKVAMVRKAVQAFPSLQNVAAIKLHLGELLVEPDEPSASTG